MLNEKMRAAVNRCDEIRHVPMGIQLIRNHHDRGRKRKIPKSLAGNKIIKSLESFPIVPFHDVTQPPLQNRYHYIVNLI